jgi:hypothetical protein
LFAFRAPHKTIQTKDSDEIGSRDIQFGAASVTKKSPAGHTQREIGTVWKRCYAASRTLMLFFFKSSATTHSSDFVYISPRKMNAPSTPLQGRSWPIGSSFDG